MAATGGVSGPAEHGPPVHLWIFPLPGDVADADLAVLDPAETARAAAYSDALLAARYVGGRVALRRILAAQLGTTAAEVAFGAVRCPQCRAAGHGPPRLAAPAEDLRFSLTRSGRWGAVVTATGFPVGVDLEGRGPASLPRMARHCLSVGEAAHVSLLEPGQRRAAFLRCWTRKETVTKASGVGIAIDLRTVETSPEEPGPVRVRHGIAAGPQDWTVSDLRPPATGLAGAVAWPADVRPTLSPGPEDHLLLPGRPGSRARPSKR